MESVTLLVRGGALRIHHSSHGGGSPSGVHAMYRSPPPRRTLAFSVSPLVYPSVSSPRRSPLRSTWRGASACGRPTPRPGDPAVTAPPLGAWLRRWGRRCRPARASAADHRVLPLPHRVSPAVGLFPPPGAVCLVCGATRVARRCRVPAWPRAAYRRPPRRGRRRRDRLLCRPRAAVVPPQRTRWSPSPRTAAAAGAGGGASASAPRLTMVRPRCSRRRQWRFFPPRRPPRALADDSRVPLRGGGGRGRRTGWSWAPAGRRCCRRRGGGGGAAVRPRRQARRPPPAGSRPWPRQARTGGRRPAAVAAAAALPAARHPLVPTTWVAAAAAVEVAAAGRGRPMAGGRWRLGWRAARSAPSSAPCATR